jgi:hypothetical protein
MRIEEFKAIEGTASDVPQVRLYSRYLLFRLSGAPVELRVSGPIIIDNGDTVRIVGRHNWNGVFEAMAYYNRSSRVCGNLDLLVAQKLLGVVIAIIGGILVLFAAPVMSLIVHEALLFTDPVFETLVLLGLLIALVGYVIFVRSQSKIRAIERLLNGE